MIEHGSRRVSSQDAQQALASTEKMKSAGLRRGLYTRWFAGLTALWAGVLSALIAFESPLWIPIFIAGIVAYQIYRRKKGAWVQEINSRREFLLVILSSLVVCAVAAGGYMGRQLYDLTWAPIAAGAAITLGLFALMEISYRPLRKQLAAEKSSD
jgi:hypothetical protein